MLGKKNVNMPNTNNILKKFNLKKFGGKNDLDFDGVPNWKDCQPRNTMRQDKYYMYHVTPKKNVPSIMSKGIQPPGWGSTNPGKIFLTPRFDVAKEYEKEGVQYPGMQPNQNKQSMLGVVIDDTKLSSDPETNTVRKQNLQKAYKENWREYEYYKPIPPSDIKNLEGASLQKQQEWKDKTVIEQNTERIIKKDTDGDRVPDEYDCEPDNPDKQDWKIPYEVAPSGALRYRRKVVMMPTEELYNKRARYNIDSKESVSAESTYKDRDAIAKERGVEPYSLSSADIVNYRLQKRKQELEEQGYKVSPVPNVKEDFDKRYYTVNYRRTPEQYKKDVDRIMSPSNIDDVTVSQRQKLISQGTPEIEASIAARKGYLDRMKMSLRSPEPKLSTVTVYGEDIKPGATQGEGRHRILAARQLGMKEIPVVVDTDKMQEGALNRYRELSPEEYKKYITKKDVAAQVPLQKAWTMREKFAAPGTMEPKREPETMQRIGEEIDKGRSAPIRTDYEQYTTGVLDDGKHRLIKYKEKNYKTVPVVISNVPIEEEEAVKKDLEKN
jgi:hypothetical protein